MHFADRSDGTGLNQFHHAPIVFTGVNLRAHLGLHASFRRCLGDNTAFVDVTGERLFAVDVLLGLQCRQGGKSVGVFGRSDDHRVDILKLSEKIAQVLVGASLGRGLQCALETVCVHVTERNDILVPAGIDMASTAAADADEANIELAVG